MPKRQSNRQKTSTSGGKSGAAGGRSAQAFIARGPRYLGHLPPWSFLVMVLAVALGAAFGLVRLQQYADEHRQSEIVLTRIEGLSHRLVGYQWQAQAQNQLDPAVRRQLEFSRFQLGASLERLGKLDPNAATLGPLNQAYGDYEQSIRVLVDLYSQGKPADARRWEIAQVNPRYESLLNVAWFARTVYREQAEKANTRAAIGSTLTMMVAALLMSLLFWQFERVKREAALAAAEEKSRSEARFRALIQNSSDVITIIDVDTKIQYQTPSVQNIFGYEPSELEGRKLIDLLHPDDVPRATGFFSEASNNPGEIGMIELTVRHADGTWKQAETVGANLLHEPAVRGFVLNTRDISERKALETQLTHQAFHDSLTDLANRALFADRVTHSLSRSQRSDKPLSVLFLDLDGFKSINDSFGHSAGDQLLLGVAERIKASIRPADTAARLGGDEFAVLLEDMTDQIDAVSVSDRILESMNHPFVIDGQEVYIGASIGIAISNLGREGADEVLRNADTAMYMAKAHGKSRYEIFEPTMHQRVMDRLELEADLRHAVHRNEYVELTDFIIHYQPIVALETGSLVGVEALVRWKHERRGVVPPLDFIPVAEDTGLIVPIGRWVLRQACLQAKEWQDKYKMKPPLEMSVNLSARQLADRDLLFMVQQTLADTGFPPTSLVLEVTESVLVRDSMGASRILQQIRELGVRVAIDDFGTGYSSLGSINDLPIDILKIDKSYIDGIHNRSKESALSRAIIEMAGSLQLETVAEGIEMKEQLSQLQGLQCRLGQGFLFARPLDSETMDALLSRRGKEKTDWAGLFKDDPTKAMTA